MSLVETIKSDLKVAMKSRDKFKTQVLRMILSEFNYASASREDEANDEVAGKVLSTYHKRLIKSLDDFPEGNKRVEIQKEADLVASFLPEKLDEDEVQAAIDQVLQSTEERQFGFLMRTLMSQLGNQADGKVLNRLLRAALEKHI